MGWECQDQNDRTTRLDCREGGTCTWADHLVNIGFGWIAQGRAPAAAAVVLGAALWPAATRASRLNIASCSGCRARRLTARQLLAGECHWSASRVLWPARGSTSWARCLPAPFSAVARAAGARGEMARRATASGFCNPKCGILHSEITAGYPAGIFKNYTAAVIALNPDACMLWMIHVCRPGTTDTRDQ